MSLIDEALRRAEQQTRLRRQADDVVGAPPPSSEAPNAVSAPPLSEATDDAAGSSLTTEEDAPAAGPRPLHAVAFLVAMLVLTVSIVAYLSMPGGQDTPAMARATPDAIAPRGSGGSVSGTPAPALARGPSVEPPEQMPGDLPGDSPGPAFARPGPAAEPSLAKASVDRTLAALMDYQSLAAKPPAVRPEVLPTPEEATESRGSGGPLPDPPAAAPRPEPSAGTGAPAATAIPATPVPASPLAPKHLSADNFRLGGILQSGDQAHALVNDKLLSVGGKIDGATVVEIRGYRVILEKDGERLILKM